MSTSPETKHLPTSAIRRSLLFEPTSSEEEYSYKKFSPGMKRWIQQEEKGVLHQLEGQLRDFARFIDDIQAKTPDEWELLSVSPLKTPSSMPPRDSIEQPMREVKALDPRPSNAPLRDAFQIVRNLLSQMSSLLHHVALTLEAHDEEHVDTHAPYFEFYYAQYVFQITFFLMQIVEEQLSQFSGMLNVVALEGNLEDAAVVDENVRPGSKAHTVLHRKGHKLCSEQRGGRERRRMSPHASCAKDWRFYPVKEGSAPSDSDVRQRIADALELLMFLSEKMLACLQGADSEEVNKIRSIILSKKAQDVPDLCPSCKLKHKFSSDVAVHGSCSLGKDSHSSDVPRASNESRPSDMPRIPDVPQPPDVPGASDGIQPLQRERLSSAVDSLMLYHDRKQSKKDSISDGGTAETLSLDDHKSGQWKLNSIRSNGIHFDINRFSSQLLEDLKKLHSQESHNNSAQSKQSTAVLNTIIRCIREASEFPEAWKVPFRGEQPVQPDKYECKEKSSRDADVEDNVPSFIRHDDIPQNTQATAPVTEEDERFDKVLDKFVVDTFKYAVRSLAKKRRSKESLSRAESFAQGVFDKEGALKEDDTKRDDTIFQDPLMRQQERKSVLMKGCKSCSDGFTLLSEYTGALSKAKLFREGAAETKEEKACTVECCEGEILHSTHDELPPGVMEVREINYAGDIIISIKEWVEEDSLDSHVLVTSMMHLQLSARESQTTLPLVKDTKKELNKGRRGLRTSVGESHLPLVEHVTNKLEKDEAIEKDETKKKLKKTPSICHSESKINLAVGFQPAEMPEIRDKCSEPFRKRQPVAKKHRLMIDKIWKFYDDLQKKNYRRGVPLKFVLRYNYFLEDAFEVIMVPSRIPLNYYRNLQVYFNEVQKRTFSGRKYSTEDDTDITDDFFYLLARQLFSTDYQQLFDYPSTESRYLYPNPASPSHLVWFEFAGVVFGLSLLHQKPLEVELPLCFFKCLLDRPLTLHDLEEIDPMLYKKLMWLKENDISEKGIQWTFTVKEKIGNIIYYPELMSKGSEVQVTEKNKFLYIEKCVKWKLAERCLTQMKGIRRGFVSVIDPKVLGIFDVEDLQHLTEQEGDYSSDSEDEDPSGYSTPRRDTY